MLARPGFVFIEMWACPSLSTGDTSVAAGGILSTDRISHILCRLGIPKAELTNISRRNRVRPDREKACSSLKAGLLLFDLCPQKQEGAGNEPVSSFAEAVVREAVLAALIVPENSVPCSFSGEAHQGLQVAAVADLSRNERGNPCPHGVAAEQFAAKSVSEARKTGGTFVTEDAMAAISGEGIEVVIMPPATRLPASATHWRAALRQAHRDGKRGSRCFGGRCW